MLLLLLYHWLRKSSKGLPTSVLYWIDSLLWCKVLRPEKLPGNLTMDQMKTTICLVLFGSNSLVAILALMIQGDGGILFRCCTCTWWNPLDQALKRPHIWSNICQRNLQMEYNMEYSNFISCNTLIISEMKVRTCCLFLIHQHPCPVVTASQQRLDLCFQIYLHNCKTCCKSDLLC